MSAVNLASSTRFGLTALRNVAEQMEVSQKRLATGKAVNTALDNVSKFFTASKMDGRAASIDTLLDSVNNAQTSLKAASEGIKGIQGIVKQARALTGQALATSDTATRASLATQFTALTDEIAKVVTDSKINGTNLLNNESITVTLNEDGTSKTTIAGVTVGLVALPLAMAFGIASGVTPQAGIYTAVVAGFLISALGGSRLQIGGPTGAFVVIVAGIVATHGVPGLLIITIMAGVILLLMAVTGLGSAVKYIPRPVTIGFTNGIAVLIASTQIKDFLGLETGTVPSEFLLRMRLLVELLDRLAFVGVFLAVAAAGGDERHEQQQGDQAQRGGGGEAGAVGHRRRTARKREGPMIA